MSNFRNLLKRLLPSKKEANSPFEKIFFADRLKEYDKKINSVWREMEGFNFIQFESDPLATQKPPRPLQIESDNPELIQSRIDKWVTLRRKSHVSSDKLMDGIQTLLKYGVWHDGIISLLDQYMTNETISNSTDTRSIMLSLLENSFRAINNDIEETYESDEPFDFEDYFENHLRLPLNMAGFYDLRFSQSDKPWPWEYLIDYTLKFEYNNQKITVNTQSDTDLFLLIRTILNGILLKNNSSYRIYRIEDCPYPILIEKDLALYLMKQHGILFFIELMGR